ncbi:MAG: tetratricopeptide repeat protein [Alphaproteobacteria bacterium]
MKPKQKISSSKFAEALAALRGGDLATAEAACRDILKRDPRHFDGLHLSGMIATQVGRVEEGIGLLQRAKAINPENPTLCYNLGLALLKHGSKEEALASMEAAARLDPDNADANRQRGEILLEMKRPRQALEVFDQAVAQAPENAEAHCNRGRALADAGMLKEALTAYEKAHSLRPDSPDFLAAIAGTLCLLRRFTEALPFIEQTLELNPRQELAMMSRVDAMLGLGRLNEALIAAEELVAAHPRSRQALNWQSRALVLADQPERALMLCAANQNIGLDDPNTHVNHGYVLGSLTRLEEALVCYDRALKLKPDDADAHYNRSFALLTLGRFEEGWLEYEYRNLRRKSLVARKYEQPLWWGRESLTGQRLYIYWEQGLGDTIQFARYALLAAAAGAKVAFSIQDPLRRLFKNFDPAVTVMGYNEKPTEFDLHCPTLSLPLAFGTKVETIPAWPSGYLKAPAEDIARWVQRLPIGRRRIGLVWSGSDAHARDALRSMPLAKLFSLFQPEDIWVSLQKEVRDSDRPALQSSGLFDPSGDLEDFADTAALISALDLVIAVDTSVAHLAGALGKPTWLMLPFAPDFRWLLKREDSPWYPSLRLFRQQRPGDWDGVIARVGAALQA